jgi:hypothetical protein
MNWEVIVESIACVVCLMAICWLAAGEATP